VGAPLPVLLVPVTLVVLVGLGLLQAILSTRGRRWLGLVLPLVWLGVAIAGSGYQVYEWSAVVSGDPSAAALGWVEPAVAFFFACNIPTAALLAIYFGCSARLRRQQAH